MRLELGKSQLACLQGEGRGTAFALTARMRVMRLQISPCAGAFVRQRAGPVHWLGDRGLPCCLGPRLQQAVRSPGFSTCVNCFVYADEVVFTCPHFTVSFIFCSYYIWPLTYRTAQGTLLNILWQSVWEGVWEEMDTCTCMAESPHCLPETITALIIGCACNACVLSHVRLWYIPIQNKV